MENPPPPPGSTPTRYLPEGGAAPRSGQRGLVAAASSAGVSRVCAGFSRRIDPPAPEEFVGGFLVGLVGASISPRKSDGSEDGPVSFLVHLPWFPSWVARFLSHTPVARSILDVQLKRTAKACETFEPFGLGQLMPNWTPPWSSKGLLLILILAPNGSSAKRLLFQGFGRSRACWRHVFPREA